MVLHSPQNENSISIEAGSNNDNYEDKIDKNGSMVKKHNCNKIRNNIVAITAILIPLNLKGL